MIAPVAYDRAPVLTVPSERDVTAGIRGILDSGFAGFVIEGGRASYTLACEAAREVGLRRESRHHFIAGQQIGLQAARRLLEADSRNPKNWNDYAMTPLHADYHEGIDVLSIAKVTTGTMEMRVLERGPALEGMSLPDLEKALWGENRRIVTEDVVDTDLLVPAATLLIASAGDTMVIHPSKPHMGITLVAPRCSYVNFFQR